MKSILLAMLIMAAAVQTGSAQNVNWRSIGEDQSNAVKVNLGYDFGATTQLGYSRNFTWVRPVQLSLDYSFPMGSDLLDDFKVTIGGQVEVVQAGGFSATLKIASIFRRYQTEMVRIVSFGSDFAAIAGYYSSSWYAAGEFGFDKAISTHLKHSDVMRSIYPAIQDGWYLPTGGHFYYGIQGSKTVGNTIDLSLRLGLTDAQGNDENAALPYYAQLGLGMRF